MLTWFPLAMLSLLSYGIQNFFLKGAARQDLSASQVTVTFCTFASLVCALLIPFLTPSVPDLQTLVLLSLGCGITYSITMLARLEALKSLDGAIVFPLVRMQGALLTLYSVLMLHELPTSGQALGVTLSLAVIALSLESPATPEGRLGQRRGYLLTLIAMLSSAANVLVCREATRTTDITCFFALSFLLTAILIALPGGVRPSFGPGPVRTFGLRICISNVVGAYALLTALNLGPLFAVSAIYNQSFVVSALLVIIFYGESLTARRIILLGTATASMLLLGR